MSSALFAIAVVEVGTTAAAGAASGLSLAALLHGFALSNAAIGLSLAVAGWPIAWHRPRNPTGWLFLAGGICYAASAAGYALLAAGARPGEAAVGWRLIATVTNGGWPWAISLLLPVSLLVFPDGTLPSRRWRWLVALAGVDSLLFVAIAVLPTRTLSTELGVRGYLTGLVTTDPGWIAAVTTTLGSVVYGAGVTALVLRYRRGDDTVRRQLLWLVLAVLIMVGGFALSDVLAVDSWLAIFSITLVPLAVLVAILRHRLLDIKLVVSRSVLYLLLTATVVGAYVGIVTLLDTALRRQIGLGSSVVATLLVAGAFHPVRLWLQRRVDRIFFGARHDPVRAIAEVGARLGAVGHEPAGLAGVLEVLCQVMRLPSASIVVAGREIAAHGIAPALRQSVPLSQGGDVLGELTVGLRTGESRLDPADERVLALLSTSLAVAVHATSLATDLGKARGALVTAREEERRRLRRDLHDGLGPALTGVVLKADAARRLAANESGQVATLLAELRAQTTTAIEDVRRLVNELRPPALDGLGLVEALRERAATLARRADGRPLRVRVEAGEPLPRLPAAVEVAAYRIATEALTNVSRHSTASTATVGLQVDLGTLLLTVSDNGRDRGEWRAGVGLTSMRERAVELGGACRAGPGPHGGQVTVTIPLEASR